MHKPSEPAKNPKADVGKYLSDESFKKACMHKTAATPKQMKKVFTFKTKNKINVTKKIKILYILLLSKTS